MASADVASADGSPEVLSVSRQKHARSALADMASADGSPEVLSAGLGVDLDILPMQSEAPADGRLSSSI